MTAYSKVITDLLAFYRRYQKYMRKFSIRKSMTILTQYFLNIYVNFGKDTVRSTAYYTYLNAYILLTDLTKAFDSLFHDLHAAKLNSYGFSELSLKMINDDLNDRKQRIRVNNCFSSWRNIVYGVPRGSIIGPLLFNIYLNDLVLFFQ